MCVCMYIYIYTHTQYFIGCIYTNTHTYTQCFIYRNYSMFRCTHIINSQSVTKIIRVTNSIKPVNYSVYLIFIADDKILFIKRCELSTVIITVHGSCQLGGCIYSTDCLSGVILMLVFLICRYDKECLRYIKYC